ncbi:aminopeptidase N [Thalassotalea ponticola]|uniref:aminopeptidase N n=1 Tax=Thalassotalea ponticola TaxID=1523392 RepID=UPI0025B39E3D|nr:aminopeptidase N [Thalassotalea ponticola]MDN3651377.1 aminopeptidase N [Thalassotalea ponticola]
MSEFTPRYLKDYQPPLYRIATVNLQIELEDRDTKVTNTMQIERQGEHNKPLKLDGEKLTLLSVSVDGVELSPSAYQLTDSELCIAVDKASFQLTIVNEINPLDNTALEGIYKSGDAFCSQCEAEGFRRISYYLDRPDILATFTTKIIAEKQKYPYLLANGNNIDSGDLDNGYHFVTWHDPYPKPCYLFALVAGDFDLLADSYTTRSGRHVALELFVDKGNLSRAQHAMDSLKKSMQWDEQVFDLEYDLDVYMIVAVDFFNMGAMENKGLNIFNSKYVLADEKSATDDDFFNIEAVIAHEYFHNWTGNRVTCRDWFQLSLKEGLTVFRDQQFSADMHSGAVNRIRNVRLLRSQQFAEDAGPMAHPIRPEKVLEMNNFYTLTVYEKGAEVIRMMHTILGEQGFKDGMALYFQRHDGQAVTCDDFVSAMSDATGVDLSLFKRWYAQSGTPIIDVSDHYDDAHQRYSMTIAQRHPDTADGQPKRDLHIPINVELLVESQVRDKQLLQLTQSEQTFVFEGITSKPVPVLLGNFSAPVKCFYDYSDDDLLDIIVNADDAFNRWDAGQQVFARQIMQLLQEQTHRVPDTVLSALQRILVEDGDNALRAEQLTIPDFQQLADMLPFVNPQHLVGALEQLHLQIAQRLATDFEHRYHTLTSSTFAKDGVAIANRALKNVCLHYLGYTDKGNDICRQQFISADNMTDEIASLHVACVHNLPCKQTMLDEFERKWQNNSLVMDKWFMLQGRQDTDEVINSVKALMQHRLFSLKNPNRARALIGGFSQGNAKHFHRGDGQGYRYLADQIIALNAINPQVASRLITPLIQYKSFSQDHQKLMLAELERIAKLEGLSRDLQEKVNAALQISA